MQIHQEHSVPFFTVLLIAFVLILFNFIQMDMMDVLGPLLQKKLSITVNDLGSVNGLFFLVDMIGIFFAGLLIDRYHIRYIIASSLFFHIMGLVIFLSHSNIATLYLWRIFAGAAMSSSYLSIIKLISLAVKKEKFGLAIGITGLAVMPAGILSHSPLLTLVNYFGLYISLLINVILGTVLILIVLYKLTVPQSFDRQTKSSREKIIIVNQLNLTAFAYAALANLPLFIFGAGLGTEYLTYYFNLSLTNASKVISCLFLGDMVGGIIWGSMFDKYINAKHFLFVGAALFTLLGFIIFSQHNLLNIYTLSLIFFLMGNATSSQTVAYANVIKNNPIHHIGFIVSIMTIVSVGLGAVMQKIFSYFFFTSVSRHYEVVLLLGVTILAINFMPFSYKLCKNFFRQLYRRSV